MNSVIGRARPTLHRAQQQSLRWLSSRTYFRSCHRAATLPGSAISNTRIIPASTFKIADFRATSCRSRPFPVGTLAAARAADSLADRASDNV